jgi:LmbE family N-acetylglucosaminyl deacetylase
MRWIYLSPHLDDAAFSCGGLLWEQAQAGCDVQIWTVCAGDPPAGSLSPFANSLHARWGSEADSGQVRREEDLRASDILGSKAVHLPIPDCIYRREKGTGNYLYDSEESLFAELHPSEDELVHSLSRILETAVPADGAGDVNLVCPLALGGHVDHQLTRAAAGHVHCSPPVCTTWYYADFPYVLEDSTLLAELPELGWRSHVFPISDIRLTSLAAVHGGLQLPDQHLLGRYRGHGSLHPGLSSGDRRGALVAKAAAGSGGRLNCYCFSLNLVLKYAARRRVARMPGIKLHRNAFQIAPFGVVLFICKGKG